MREAVAEVEQIWLEVKSREVSAVRQPDPGAVRPRDREGREITDIADEEALASSLTGAKCVSKPARLPGTRL